MCFFFFQAEDGIRDLVRSRGLGDVYKRQLLFPVGLITVLYHYGAFTAADVEMTARALRGYGFGLLGLVSIKVLAPAFYARMDIRTPVAVSYTHLTLPTSDLV